MSYRARDSWGDPPPYRRGGRNAVDERGVSREDAHKERVVEAALRAGRSTAPTPSDAASLGLRMGDDVEHPTFGEGTIIDIRGDGDRAEATIRFREVGTKHLSLAWAPLKKL
jgi:DNA helicase-2/ATP-dependent DNA helicase PcrA